MNAARRAARAGRNLLIALVVGAVIIVVIVVAYMAGRTTSEPAANPEAPTTASQATESPDEPSGAAPTGCVGGSSLDSAMVLSAQQSAPRTSFGAVEVAAAFFRWTYQSPHPTRTDVRAASAIFLPDSAVSAQRDLMSEYERHPDPSNGVVENGRNFHLTTVGARWVVQAGVNDTRQRVSILAPFVIDGEVSATKTAAEAFELQWTDGAWRVVGLAEVDSSKVAVGGTAFSAGC